MPILLWLMAGVVPLLLVWLVLRGLGLGSWIELPARRAVATGISSVLLFMAAVVVWFAVQSGWRGLSSLFNGEPGMVRAVRAANRSYYSDNEPRKAVDGDLRTAWNSGAMAPQSLEIDLGEAVRVTGLDGLPMMTPDGHVVHTIEGMTGDGQYVTLGTYDGHAQSGEWIRIECASPEPVRHVRVTTSESPSWVAWFEVRVRSQ